MPAVVPLAVAAVGAGASMYNAKKQRDAQKKAAAQGASQMSSDQKYREQLLQQMFGGGGGQGQGLSGMYPPQAPGGHSAPRGGGGSGRTQSAEELYNRINTDISLDQWKAWEGKQDPSCPESHPFRTDKKVSGGDQNECVETPDNCPEGTTAFGKDQCIPVNDKRIGGGGGPWGGGGPGGNMPDPRGGGPGGGYPGGPGGMYPYAGPQGVYGNSYVGGDYGLSSMYQGLLGNSAQQQAFLASQTQGLQAQLDGQRKQIMATVPPGGQRDKALAELEKGHSQALSQMRQGLLGSSMQGLQGLYGTQLGDATNRYGIDTSAATSRYGIDVGARTAADQLGLGWAELGQRGSQFDRNFGLDQLRYLTGSSQWDQQFNYGKQQDLMNQNNQRNQALMGTIGGLANAYFSNKYGGGGGWGGSGKSGLLKVGKQTMGPTKEEMGYYD